VRDRMASAQGITRVAGADFAGVLRETVGAWLADGERQVLMCGMVGSRQGWVEAPYLPCPASPDAVAAALVTVPFEGAQVLLVPGLSARDAAGVPEVMRGEETKLVGLMAAGHDGLVCMPGSHTKWARIEGGRIAGFETYFTGEGFAALREATILGRMMAPGGTIDPDGFRRGVARAGAGGHLLHHLFGVRTLGLFGELDEAAAAGFLSGLLIGHEVRAAMDGPGEGRVKLVGDPALVGLYATAVGLCGGTAEVLEFDAAIAGLALIGGRAAWN